MSDESHERRKVHDRERRIVYGVRSRLELIRSGRSGPTWADQWAGVSIPTPSRTLLHEATLSHPRCVATLQPRAAGAAA